MKNYIENSLSKLWSNYQNEYGQNPIFKREYVFAIPRKSDILITGINPSNNGKPKHSFSFDEADYRYFTKLKKIAPNATYLDLFYIRGIQNELNEFTNNSIGILFLADQLKLTQELIEEIVKPKLILVFNKGSWGYWGYYENIIWMGYEFKFEKELEFGKLMRITGLKKHPERISSNITKTNLENTLVYFSKYLNYTSNEEIAKIKEEIEQFKY